MRGGWWTVDSVTTDAIKFKAKSWIDVSGGHTAKAVGSLINNGLKSSVDGLVVYGSLVSVFFSISLGFTASWLGRAFELQSASGRNIGDDSGEEAQSPFAEGVELESAESIEDAHLPPGRWKSKAPSEVSQAFSLD